DQRHEQEDAEHQRQHVDQRNEKTGYAPPWHFDHRAIPPDWERSTLPSCRIISRPNWTIHIGKMLMRAISSPLPVAVMAGEYFSMISFGVTGPLIEPNVCRMPATVPIKPKSGNHSAAWARFDKRRSSSSLNPVSRQRSARQLKCVCQRNRTAPEIKINQSIF